MSTAPIRRRREDWLNDISQVAAPLVLGSLVAIAVVVANGGTPGMFFTALWKTITTPNGFFQTMANAAALTLTAQCFIIGARCGVFNIGAEGAMFMGAAATLYVGAEWPMPYGLHLLAVMLVSMIAGAVWILPASLLKTYRNVHEIVTTIMLNFIARFFLSFLIVWPLKDRFVDIGAFANEVLPTARFPVIASPLTWAFLLALLVAVATYVLLWFTRLGTHIRAAGANADAALAAGVDVKRLNSMAFLLGGAAAGLAGCVLTAGLPPSFTVNEDLSALRNFGFLGISVALIGRNHPIGAIFAAIFVATVRTSRFQFQKLGVAPEVTEIFIGAVIFAFAFPFVIQSTLAWVRDRRAALAATEAPHA